MTRPPSPHTADKHELVNPASDKLLATLTAADELFKSVKMTREAALDSNIVLLTSKYAAQQAQKLQTSFVQLDPTVFREKVAGLLRGHAAIDEVLCARVCV